MFLGCVDLLGGKFESESIATGFGAHLAQPILRRLIEGKSGGARSISFEEAKSAIDSCMKTLYYRDARSLNKVISLVLIFRSNMAIFLSQDKSK